MVVVAGNLEREISVESFVDNWLIEKVVTDSAQEIWQNEASNFE